MNDLAKIQEPIAIVGMAVRFPGADDTHSLWETLENGLNTVVEIPGTRFDVRSFNDTSRAPGRRMNAGHGNFIKNFSTFDNSFFHISPREARSMDPQQRLLLEVSYHALEDAGYVPNVAPSFNPSTFGTFVGATTSDYLHNLRNDIDVYYSTGTISAFLSGRISYTFGFCGPSMVVDTTCSSSIVAIHQACRALVVGDCNAAIAGGVNIITSPDMHIGLDRAHFLSPTGQCRPWDASADGYCRAEGCGMFVLKRLSDALAENDRILGVIRSIEVNQSANAESITHPHVPTQIKLFEKVLASAGVEPEDVSVVEAHGTGTQAGDPAELESIRSVLTHGRTTDNPLHVTSVKANIGHAESASGAASLAKLLLMFEKNTVPPNVSLKTLNPRIPPLDRDCVVIDTTACSWTRTEKKRLALLNNFGASGSNAGLLLEEPPHVANAPCTPSLGLVGLSADTRGALEALRAAYVETLDKETHSGKALADVSYSSVARRRLYRYRLSVTGRSCEELARKLETASILDVNTPAEKIIFVCSGQGSQYLGMGGDLYHTVPKFREIVNECNSKLLSWSLPGILHILLPLDYPKLSAGDNLRAFQVVVFVIQYAVATMWSSWGVRPDAVVGHSLGEYAALVIGGVLSWEDGLCLVAQRARLIVEHCKPYVEGMLAVHMKPEDVATMIVNNTKYGKLKIACYNSPTDCVMAGGIDILRLVEADLKHSGQVCKMLDVPFAYHTLQLYPIQGPLLEIAARISFSSPSIPIFSNVQGDFVFPGDNSVFTAEYLVRHSLVPVQFHGCSTRAQSLDGFEAGILRWIEIGPHPTTLPMLRASTSDRSSVYHTSLRKDTESFHTLLNALSQLYTTSLTINWQAVFADLLPQARLTQLPAYPFSKESQFYVPFQEESMTYSCPNTNFQPPSQMYTVPGTCLALSAKLDGTPIVFESNLESIAELVDGHNIAGYALCPASVYIEAAHAAVQSVLSMLGQGKEEQVICLSNLLFTSPLSHDSKLRTYLRTAITIMMTNRTVSGHFQITSSTDCSHGNSQLNCAGVFKTRPPDSLPNKLVQERPVTDRRLSTIRDDPEVEIFRTRTVYEAIFAPTVVYSAQYQSIQAVSVHSNGIDSYAEFQLPKNDLKGTFTLNPIFLDTIVHLAGFVLNLRATPEQLYICDRIGKIEMLSNSINWTARHYAYCSVNSLSDTSASATVLIATFDDKTCRKIVARMKDIRFKRLRVASLTTSLSRYRSQKPEFSTQHIEVDTSLSSADITLVEDTLRDPPLFVNMESLVTSTISDVLEVPASDISIDIPLCQLGLDSLAVIEALNGLQSVLNITLPAGFLVGDTCLRDVVNFAKGGLPTHPYIGTRTPLSIRPSGDTEQAFADDIFATTTNVLVSVLGIKPIDLSDDDELARYGLDSLAVIEAHHELEQSLNIRFPTELLNPQKTLRDVQDALTTVIETARGSFSTVPSHINSSLVQLQDGNPLLLPLILIHDGSGLISSYTRLQSLGRKVYGISNPRFGSPDPWKGGILGIALTYASMIEDMECTGCILGGWSIGGVIAFETSRLLRQRGRLVSGLILIDSPSPDTSEPLPEALIERFTVHPNPRFTSAYRVETHMRLAGHALTAYDRHRSPAADVSAPAGVILRCREGVNSGIHSSSSAAWLTDRREISTIAAPWKVILESIAVIDVAGNHFTAFHDEHIPDMTAGLKEALATLDSA